MLAGQKRHVRDHRPPVSEKSNLLQDQPKMSDAYDDSPLFAKRESNQRGYRDALKFSMRSPWIFFTLWILLGGVSALIHFIAIKV